MARQPAFGREPARYAIAETFRAKHPDILRPAKRQPYPDFARLVESTGRQDHGKIELRVTGADVSFPVGATVPRTAAGVKTALRRVREQETAIVEAAEARVAAAQRELQEAKQALAAAKAEAFQKGHVVRLQEVEAVIAEREAARQVG